MVKKIEIFAILSLLTNQVFGAATAGSATTTAGGAASAGGGRGGTSDPASGSALGNTATDPEVEQEPEVEKKYVLPGFKWSQVFRRGDDGIGDKNAPAIYKLVQVAFDLLLKNDHKFYISLFLNYQFDPSRGEFKHDKVYLDKVTEETLRLPDNISTPFEIIIGKDTILNNNAQRSTVEKIEEGIDNLTKFGLDQNNVLYISSKELQKIPFANLKLEIYRTQIMVYLFYQKVDIHKKVDEAYEKVGTTDTFYVCQAGTEGTRKFLFSISRGENDTIIVHPNYDADREWQRKFEVRRSPNTPAETQNVGK